MKKVWNQIRPNKTEKPWASLVWHKSGLARHQTTSWLLVLNRNPTLDRVVIWDPETEETCLLCGSGMESRDHLFFVCSYSVVVWRGLTRKLSISDAPIEWEQIMQWLMGSQVTTPKRLALLQAWQGATYELWRERNRRFHDGITIPPLKVLSFVLRTVVDKCRAMSLLGSDRGTMILQQWSQSIP